MPKSSNTDPKTVEGFGQEWSAFDQLALPHQEQEKLFAAYFSEFPWERLSSDAEGFDLGCGSGRWAALMAQRVGTLHCIDASQEAIAVARRALADMPNAHLYVASVDEIPLADNSQDFGYSIGVLHHVPDTQAGLAACVKKLKIGAPFVIYLYYRFDNRPARYRLLWRVADGLRHVVSRLPFGLRRAITDLIATFAYWPLARGARLGEKLGANVEAWPLSAYRAASFYTMRTDALDRFGTRLEQRFTRSEIEDMMRRAGLGDIRFREDVPYWVAVGCRKK